GAPPPPGAPPPRCPSSPVHGQPPRASQGPPDDRVPIRPPARPWPHPLRLMRRAVSPVGRAAAEAEVVAFGVADRPLAGVDRQTGEISDQAGPFGRNDRRSALDGPVSLSEPAPPAGPE